MRKESGLLLIPVLLAACVVGSASAQTRTSAGEKAFDRECRICHDGSATTRAPSREVLQERSPKAILDALNAGGPMQRPGARLSPEEKRSVVEFLTGRTLGEDVTGASAGRCERPEAFSIDPARPGWNGWGVTVDNARFQPGPQAGLKAGQLSKLKLKWAFGFPDASAAWSQPTVQGGRVFVGSQNGTFYSLNARTGCIHWIYSAQGSVRTAPVIAKRSDANGYAVYFGDLGGRAYAVDAESGRQLWVRKVEDHPYVRLTGAPVFYQDRLYVPVASLEEGMNRDPDYPCCSFRGSVLALDAKDGSVIWKAYMITQPLKVRGVNKAGVKQYGPSGAAVWSAPTIDVARKRLYVGTGNGYTGPDQPTNDAVIALDMASGKIAWSKQLYPKDVTYVDRCTPGPDNPECPEERGPDFDFGNSPILTKAQNGKDVIVIGQKSGVGWAIDPSKDGAVLWQYRAGAGGSLGGMEWGSAADGQNAYFPVSDIQREKPGGLHAVDIQTGKRVWFAPPQTPQCKPGQGCNAALSAAITVIPGVVFAGSNDGVLRAHSTADGSILWEYDTNKSFETLNGVAANGASMIGPGPVVVGGMLYVNSGYGSYGGRPGNVLLAFGVE
jgi:polyvinyl alcohol dehydrogenase (cytochrome)